MAIVALGALAYANSLHGPFVFDDPTSITGNATIRHLSDLGTILRTPQGTVSAQGRPLLNLSLAINYAISGQATWSYHLANLLIHLGAALVLFGILRRTFLARPEVLRGADAATVAGFTALLWCLHPLQTEAVTYVIQRAESLMSLCYLLTLYCFIRGWRAAAVACCVCGMATKENMVSAPFLVLLYDRAVLAGSFREAWRRHWRTYLALFATLALLFYCIRVLGHGDRGGSVGFDLHVDRVAYWRTQFVAVTHYLELAFWPHPLVFEYGTFWLYALWPIWGKVICVAILALAALGALVRAPLAGCAAFLFFAVLAPTSLVPGTTQMIVEHRMYLPLAGVLALTVVALVRAERRCASRLRVVPCVLGGAALALGWATFERNEDYRDAVTLWEKTVELRPGNSLAHVMLGQVLDKADRSDEAWIEYRRAIELRPSFGLAHQSLGELLLRRGQVDDAIEEFRAVLRQKPADVDALANLGVALGELGQYAAGMREERKAIAAKPDFGSAYYDLGNLLADSGKAEAAVAQYREALKYIPDYAGAHQKLAEALTELGRKDEAAAEFHAAERIRSAAKNVH